MSQLSSLSFRPYYGFLSFSVNRTPSFCPFNLSFRCPTTSGLRGNSLTRAPSPDMCQLTGLWYFDVRGNNLTGPCVSYQITKINLYKDGRHGKAWGVVHKEGLPAADAPKKISRVHKRGWRYIPSLSKSTESVPSVSKPTETAPATPEVQPA